MDLYRPYENGKVLQKLLIMYFEGGACTWYVSVDKFCDRVGDMEKSAGTNINLSGVTLLLLWLQTHSREVPLRRVSVNSLCETLQQWNDLKHMTMPLTMTHLLLHITYLVLTNRCISLDYTHACEINMFWKCESMNYSVESYIQCSVLSFI